MRKLTGVLLILGGFILGGGAALVLMGAGFIMWPVLAVFVVAIFYGAHLVMNER